ncbi:protein of unknown function [Candidatus Nitrosocosmicus franklandus]|uniref:Uncharacterized protein n=1 Tax=Candidatus Nitrosocosmicus franklandianus TaxID=1798806 RepID=A0A484IF42_9ARCH|nr:protein of unknown function [Candidatus Nitrosocosmicus franklandus]
MIDCNACFPHACTIRLKNVDIVEPAMSVAVFISINYLLLYFN